MWARPFFLTFLFYLTSPTTANVLFLPRGHLYASYDHWTLHIPIETRTSWTFVLKLEHHVKLFKSKVSSIFAEHRQQLRSDQAIQLFAKFNQSVKVIDIVIDTWSNAVLVDLSETNVSLPEAVNFIPPLQDKSVHLSNLKKHIQQIRVRNAQHNKTVVIPAISVTTCIVVALVLLTVLYVRCHVFKPIMIRPQKVSAQNPAPDSVIVEETSSVAPNIKPREKLTDPSPSCLQWLKQSPTLASQNSADV